MNELLSETKMMASLEISKIIGKQHKNTMKLIKSLIDKDLIQPAQFELGEYKDLTGRPLPMYRLDKAASILLVAQQSPELTANMIDRWEALESQQPQPKRLSRVQLAANWLEVEKKVEALEAQALLDKPKVAVYDSLAKLWDAQHNQSLVSWGLGTTTPSEHLRKWLKP